MNVLDLFSGIGGFSLGLEAAGMRTIQFCEIEPFCQEVLKKHWPKTPLHKDVSTLDGRNFIGSADIVCGGFPCQDLSVAGHQRGIQAERSGLWKEFHRIIRELRPKYAIVENVPNLLSGPPEHPGLWFGRLLGDLAEIGYDAEWHCLPAAKFGATHFRDRVWIIAHPHGLRRNSLEEGSKIRRPIIDFESFKEEPEWEFPWDYPDFLLCDVDGFFSNPRSGVERNDDGLPEGMDRLKACGNSVFPRIPKFIGSQILKYESEAVIA